MKRTADNDDKPGAAKKSRTCNDDLWFDALRDSDDKSTALTSLIESNKELVKKRDIHGNTPLHFTIKYGNTTAINALIDAGADVNARDNDGCTPLHFTIKYGFNTDNTAINALIDAGADVNARDDEEHTPLHYAFKYGFNTNNTAINALIDAGADVNARDNEEHTPLHYALMDTNNDNHNKAALLFINNGADVNATNNRGDTPLHDACSFGRRSLVEVLVGKGAVVDARNNYQRTPLHNACKAQYPIEVALFLIGKGADVNAYDNEMKTPIEYISFYDTKKKLINLIIRKYPEKVFASEDEDKCPICQYNPPLRIRLVTCMHSCCAECMQTYCDNRYNDRKTCPICRQTFPREICLRAEVALSRSNSTCVIAGKKPYTKKNLNKKMKKNGKRKTHKQKNRKR
jgi:ankyrin repeat protein